MHIMKQNRNLAKLTLSVLFALFAGLHISAYDATVGDLESAQANNVLPMFSLYNYSYTQQIYTAAEIGAPGVITSITLWLYGNANLPEMSFDIYLKETDKEAFESTDDWVSVTADDLVFSGKETIHNTTAKPYTFYLDTLFEYSGRSNLLVCFNNKTGSWKEGLYGMAFASSSENFQRSIYVYRDDNAYDPTNPTFTAKNTTNYRNVMTFEIQMEGNNGVPWPSTFTVSDLSFHGATLTWTGGTGTFNMEYKREADDLWTTIYNRTWEQSYTLSDLQPNTTYLARVQSVDPMDFTSFWKTIRFTTPAIPVPTNFTVSDIYAYGATLSWESDAPAFQICLDDNEKYLINSERPIYALGGLEPDTRHSVKVRADYGNGDVSEWTKSVSFRTDTPWPVPADVTISDIGPTSAVVSWTSIIPDVTQHEFELALAPEGDLGGEWYYYDNGTYDSAIGSAGGQLYWGVMFPAGSYTGSILSAVSVYDCSAMTGTVTIYNDGETAPTNPIASSSVNLTGAEEFVEIPFGSTLIDNTRNLWVVFYNESGANYPAAYSSLEEGETADPNGRWVSLDGVEWKDLADYGFDSPWMIRAQISNGGQINWMSYFNPTSPMNLTGLTPETDYMIRIKDIYMDGGHSKWATASFRTLEANPVPFDVTVEPDVNFATLSWNGFGDSYSVRYKKVGEIGETLEYDFDDSSFGEWTTIDADGDGYTWELGSAPVSYLAEGSSLSGTGHNESNDFVLSGSYSNLSGVGILFPDNYLVSPQITLGGTITFWACGQDSSYPREHFGVAVSTTGNTNAEDFTTIQEWDMTAAHPGPKNGPLRSQGCWYEFTVDLSAYAGRTGYVAIRHFGCSDQFLLNIDDISIICPADGSAPGSWKTVSTRDKSIVLNGLNPNTMYQYQMRSSLGSSISDWSEMATFTTLSTVPTGINDVTVNVNDGHWYTVDGKRLNAQPKAKGIYIRNGHKVVIK